MVQINNKKRNIFFVIKKSFVILMLIIFIPVFTGCFSTTDLGNSGTNGNSDDESINGTNEITTYEYLIGDTVSFCNIEYTVKQYRISKYYDWLEVSNANNNLCIIDIEVYNSTNETKNFKEGLFFPSHIYTYSLYCEGVQGTGLFDNSNVYLLSHDSIMAREKLNCVLVYEISSEVLNQNTEDIYLEITLNKIAERTEIHNIKLK